jgi:hypothetical protein
VLVPARSKDGPTEEQNQVTTEAKVGASKQPCGQKKDKKGQKAKKVEGKKAQKTKKTGKRVTFNDKVEIQIIENTSENRRKKNRKQIKRRKDKFKTRNLKILYNNINGIRGKIKSLTDTIEITQSDVIILTETKGQPPLIKKLHLVLKREISWKRRRNSDSNKK